MSWAQSLMTRWRPCEDGLDIRTLLAESLHMGDEGHNRNKAGSIIFTTKLAPYITATTEDRAVAADISLSWATMRLPC